MHCLCLPPTPSLEENRKEGGEANFWLECSLFQSAGKRDKEVALGTLGIEGGGGTGPIHTEQEGYGPSGIRAGCGAGPGRKFLNDRPAGWPGQGLSPLLGTCTAKSSVSSKQEKS